MSSRAIVFIFPALGDVDTFSPIFHSYAYDLFFIYLVCYPPIIGVDASRMALPPCCSNFGARCYTPLSPRGPDLLMDHPRHFALVQGSLELVSIFNS